MNKAEEIKELEQSIALYESNIKNLAVSARLTLSRLKKELNELKGVKAEPGLKGVSFL